MAMIYSYAAPFKISSSKILSNTKHIGKHFRRAFQRSDKTVTRKDERHSASKNPIASDSDKAISNLLHCLIGISGSYLI